MRLKGINYDTGITTTQNTLSRESLDPPIVQREIEIIKNDLHCNAICISGQSLESLVLAAKIALRQGLEVWFSPSLAERTEAEALKVLAECAQAAEDLRRESAQIVFVAGVELTAFMRGFLEGETAMQRLGTLINPLQLIKSTILKGSFHKKLNTFLSKATPLIREHFRGKIAYASGPWEEVDWSRFDFVGVDYYRDAMNKKVYEKNLRAYFKHGKPVVITEFGCCTYQGAAERGGYGWVIVDWTRTPPQLKRRFFRDEASQAGYLLELLEIFTAENVEGAFVFTFVSPSYPYDQDPLYDLDMASYSLVKTYKDQQGRRYPDMPWEPKEAFLKLGDYYRTDAP
jgi:hypothetical protein